MLRTPLFDAHVEAGGRMVGFAGYDMPVQYTGLIDEHTAVRTRCGLFDVSHMAEIDLRGAQALAAVQHLVCGDVATLKDGQAMYTGMLNERAGFVDDLIVYRFSAEHIFLVVNAANHAKDFAWVQEQVAHASSGVQVVDLSENFAQIAIQGPFAEAITSRVASVAVSRDAIGFFHFVEGEICGRPTIIARTGYTGEDGFELYMAPQHAKAVWDGLRDAGVDEGIACCGLGARDTLRLEAKLMLYGNDIDDEHTPLEAGLKWIVAFGKDNFMGKAALDKQAAAGIQRKLVGFEMIDRGIPRHGYPVVDDAGTAIGVITSGTQSPTLNKPIALGYVPKDTAKIGTQHWVEIRGKRAAMRVVKTPHYKRS